MCVSFVLEKIWRPRSMKGFAGYDIENNFATRQATSFQQQYNYERGFCSLFCSFLYNWECECDYSDCELNKRRSFFFKYLTLWRNLNSTSTKAYV